MPDLNGQQLGGYRIVRRLGRGAMAEVYLAEQASLARQVALKVLNPDLARNENYVERFQHEARAAAALVHARIIQIYEVGQSNGYHFIAQEYVPGQNLGELIERERRLAPGLTLDVLRQVASALGKAAERGIVHRDIKPENVMLARSGEVKVADFGLARVDEPGAVKLTQIGVTMGTPLYMSPEQIEGRAVDTRSDLYSLGVTAYQMLAGEPPFLGETPMAVAAQHLNAAPTPLADRRPDAPAGLVKVIERLMAKKPAERPQSPADLLAELQVLAAGGAREGWFNESSPLSAAELSTSGGLPAEATAQLGQMMRRASEAQRAGWRWGRAVLLVLGSLLAGGLLAAATRPAPLLAGAEKSIAQQPDVLRQVYYAKVLGTSEAAWLAVADRFPEADPYYHRLADQNLARLYLRWRQPERALPLCRRLAQLGEGETEFSLFGWAGLVVCELAQGDREAAQRAREQLPADGLRRLRRFDPQMARDYEDVLSELAR